MTEASATLEAAYGLVRDLNRQARFVILGTGEPGNSQGGRGCTDLTDRLSQVAARRHERPPTARLRRG